MFIISKNGTNRLDIVMSGQLDEASMKIALDELVEKSKGIENGKMLYKVIDFHLPTLGAIAIEFSHLPSMFGLVNKFDRAAVLSDKIWIQKVSELKGFFYPSMEIKAFNLDQQEEAEIWLLSQGSSE